MACPDDRTPTETVLQKLPGAKRDGTSWRVRCPAHDGKSADSLVITEGDNGTVLLFCHGGCETTAICSAIGIETRDLFVKNGRGQQRRATKATHSEPKTPPPWLRPIETTNDYTDEQDTALFQVVRFGDGLEPRFMQRHQGEGGRWVWNIKGIRRVLLGLPRLLAADPQRWVFIPEGEKDVDRLLSQDMVATCNAMGAGNWKPEYADQLKNRKCCIIADNDDPGRRHAEDVARSLHGVAAEVRMLELPGLPVGGDVSDWLDAGGTRDELEKLLERTDEWAPTRAAPNENKPADHAKAEPPTDKTPKQKQKRKRPQVPAFQPFPVDVLPEPLSSFVSVGSKAIGCDASYVALPLLAGLASAIGNTHRIQIKYGWSEPSVLWCVIIGESGSLKSPAIDAALGHIRQRQAKAFSEFKQEMKEYERELEVHNADMSEWKKTGHKNGEPLPLSPDKPTSGRCWCSDTTIEALAQILDNAPRGILVIRDELSGWLRSFDAYKSGKGGDVAHYLEMHRAGHLLVDRKTGDKATISVPRAAVSIIGGIQPETLRRALGEENFENGLAARFLMTMPPRRTKRWRNTTLDRVLEDHLNSVFDWLFSLEAGVDENNEPRPVLVPLSPEGQQAWIRFYDDFAVEQANLTGELAAAMSKLEGCGARLALIVHLVRCATGELNLGDPIDAESVGKGVSLIQWFVHETKRVYAILGETDGDREIRQIVELIQRKGGRISVRDFQRTRSYPSSDDATAELAKLVEAGIGSWESVNPAAGGRPSKHFVLSDTLTTDKTTTHDHANRGFVSCQSVSGDGNNNNDDWGVI